MRGFKDNIPPISYALDHVRRVFERYSRIYGCAMIDLPLVEEAGLYFRTSGNDSDICNKELFEVRKYKGEFEDWVLRPEGTASCMRAIKDANLMEQAKFWKFAYFGPMFRYNRPQKGRYRQFMNAGWEFVGVEGAEIDCELILGAKQFLDEFKLDYTLEINSIGSAEDRKIYRKVLADHFKNNQPEHELKEPSINEGEVDEYVDNKNVANKNIDNEHDDNENNGLPKATKNEQYMNQQYMKDPLKILDKAESFANIPKLKINLEDAKEFDALQSMLNFHNVKFIHNPYLVRGLDYYNATVFEFKINNQAVLAGGRYDSLMEQIGGKYTPATGFGAGVDRIVNNIMNETIYQNASKNIAIISLDANEYAQQVATKLRFGAQLSVENKAIELAYEGCVIFWRMNLQKALAEASKQGYQYVIICGSSEASSNTIILKDLNSSTQHVAKIG